MAQRAWGYRRTISGFSLSRGAIWAHCCVRVTWHCPLLLVTWLSWYPCHSSWVQLSHFLWVFQSECLGSRYKTLEQNAECPGHRHELLGLETDALALETSSNPPFCCSPLFLHKCQGISGEPPLPLRSNLLRVCMHLTLIIILFFSFWKRKKRRNIQNTPESIH